MAVLLRYFLALLLISFEATSCGDQQPSFYPFAKTLDVDMRSYKNPDIKTIELLSPIRKKDMYLSSVTIEVENDWVMNIDFRETADYQEEYYRSTFTLHQKYLDKATITLSYNTTKKDRSSLAFFANWKIYSLTELLERRSKPEAPMYLLFPPPPRTQEEITVREFIQSLFASTD
ncbi:hypothetical protein [Thalassotalea litorea]|uniref:hypothetical protein n=1 Tax=Thalassotalea litorea TaxID=2020715 RepID=UPI003735C579